MNNMVKEVEEPNGMVHVQVDRKEWDEVLDRLDTMETKLGSASTAFKIIGGIVSTLMGSVVVVGILVYTTFTEDRRAFVKVQQEDKALVLELGKNLALTQQQMSAFTAIGPRFTPEMNKAADDGLEARVKEWVRANFVPLK